MEQNKWMKSSYLASLTWPIFVELLLQMLVGNVDQLMVGRQSQISVAAIGNSNQIINVLIITFSVISMATTILISQYLGSGNRKKASEIYSLALVVNGIFGIAVSLILVFFSEQIFRWMQVPAEMLGESKLYIGIIGSCMVFQAIFLTFSAIFRSNALMKESMLVSVIINLLNIFGNALLIGGNRTLGIAPMGIAGAAISSCISRVVGVLLIYWLFRVRIGERISLALLRPFPWPTLRRLLEIGLPSGGESLSYNMTQVFIQKIANQFGTYVISTKVYASMFANLSYLYASAVGQASQIIVGYLIGAREMDNADRRVRLTLRSSIGVSFIISLTLYLCSDFLYGFFTQNPEVIALGKIIMLIEIPLELGRAVNIVLVRALQATGDIQFPITLGIICMWGIAVGGGFLLGSVLGYGLVGIWIAMALDELTRAFVFLLRWRSGAWRSKSFLEKAS